MWIFKKAAFVILVFIMFVSNCSMFKNSEIHFYISEKGDDEWSGSFPKANRDRTDGPFLTFERANQAVQSVFASREGGEHRIIVNVNEGTYYFKDTFKLLNLNQDEGNAVVVWRAIPGDSVRLIGGKEITGFTDIENPAIWNRLDKKARAHVVQIDLHVMGISDYGEITRRGTPGMELFSQGRKMKLARYPNDGWLKIANVPQQGMTLFHKGLDREKRFNNVPVGRHYGRIVCGDDRPKRWSLENEAYVHGYWTWDWSDSYQKVKRIDTAANEIVLEEPHHNYGYTTNQRFYFLNILEELDSPGEWYLDRKKGIAYWWPPDDSEKNTAIVSSLKTPLVEINQCRNVCIEGFIFEISRGNGIVINGGSNVVVAGCTFRLLGDNAVVVNGGVKNGVQSCDFYDLALGGVVLRGGARKTLTPAGNFAVNNHIHHYSNWLRTWQLAVNISGVGNSVANNLIHDAPHEAIYVRGNDHALEYNEIHNVCQETGDAGAIHTGRNYTWRGNLYRYNYLHDLKGPGLHGVAAIYLDDFTSGYTIYGNICCNAGRGTLVGGGRDNVIENNVYIGCSPSIVLDARGLSWAGYYFDGTYTVLEDSMDAMNALNPPYSQKYPELVSLYNDEPAVPKNNVITRNISYKGKWIELYDYFMYDRSVITHKDNVIADEIICKRMAEDPGGWEPYYLNLDTDAGYVSYKYGDAEIMEEFSDNLILNNDPGFVDVDNRDFRLRKDAPALNSGFKQIPIEKIGLYTDQFRKKLP